MGKNKNRNKLKHHTKNSSKLKKIDPSRRIVTTLVNKKSFKCPVELCSEYTNLLGNKIPDSHEDIDNVIDILLLHYNRVITSYDLDQDMLNKIKKAVLNLAQIFNYYIYDIELIKLLKVLELIEYNSWNNDVQPDYIKDELKNINSSLIKNEKKFFTRLISRLLNKSVQIRYLNGLVSNIEKEIAAIESKELTGEDLNKFLEEFDNLSV